MGGMDFWQVRKTNPNTRCDKAWHQSCSGSASWSSFECVLENGEPAMDEWRYSTRAQDRSPACYFKQSSQFIAAADHTAQRDTVPTLEVAVWSFLRYARRMETHQNVSTGLDGRGWTEAYSVAVSQDEVAGKLQLTSVKNVWIWNFDNTYCTEAHPTKIFSFTKEK